MEAVRTNEEFTESESELHGELIAANIFKATMIGAVVFVLVCAKVMFIG